MAIPAVPTTFTVQSGQQNNFIQWDMISGATSYVLQRSTDGVNFTTLITLSAVNPGGGAPWNYYLDAGDNVSPAGPTVGTQYWYQVNATNGSGSSVYTTPATVVTVDYGIVSLGYLRYQAQSRCDRINSTFVSKGEWNSYITEARKQFYNIMTTAYGNDYFVANPYTYTLSGSTQFYPLPSDFYKLLGVEVALNGSDPLSWVTIKKFEFIERNRWSFPNVYTFYGITNLRYRLNGSNIYMVPPTLGGGQTMRIWYVPRPKTLLADTDIVDGIAGYEEFVIVTAAMIALIKEESPTAAEFKALKDEQIEMITDAANNRDIAQPEQVSDTKRINSGWSDEDGNYGSGSGYGGGF
jgi:hypothetical protein